jgi:hypothetical protein
MTLLLMAPLPGQAADAEPPEDSTVLTTASLDPEEAAQPHAIRSDADGNKSEDSIRAYYAAHPELIHQFYDSHPELFTERRVYSFDRIAISGSRTEVPPGLRAELDELDKHADKSTIMPELDSWLRSQGREFKQDSVTMAAEALPFDVLPKFQRLAAGDIVLMSYEDKTAVWLLTNVRAEPMSFAEAAQFIREFLIIEVLVGDASPEDSQQLNSGQAAQ